MPENKEYVEEQISRLSAWLADSEVYPKEQVIEWANERAYWQQMLQMLEEQEAAEPEWREPGDILDAVATALLNIDGWEKPTEKEVRLMDDIRGKAIALTSFAVDRIFKDMESQLKWEKVNKTKAVNVKKEDKDADK